MTANSQPLSACHKAAVHVGGDDTEGTHYYVCDFDNMPCDLLPQKPEVSHTVEEHRCECGQLCSDDYSLRLHRGTHSAPPDGSDELEDELEKIPGTIVLLPTPGTSGRKKTLVQIPLHRLIALIDAKVVEARIDEWYRMNPLDDDNSLLTADGLRYLAERITALKAEQEGVR